MPIKFIEQSHTKIRQLLLRFPINYSKQTIRTHVKDIENTSQMFLLSICQGDVLNVVTRIDGYVFTFLHLEVIKLRHNE